MAEIVGVEKTKLIYENFRGQQVTFPQRLYDREYVTGYVKDHYNGKNLKELSFQFGYSERRIREMLKENVQK